MFFAISIGFNNPRKENPRRNFEAFGAQTILWIIPNKVLKLIWEISDLLFLKR